MFFKLKRKVFQLDSENVTLLLDAVTYPVVIIDSNYLLVNCNQALCKLLSYTKRELIQKSFDFILSGGKINSAKIIKEIIQGSVKKYDVCFKAKSGENISVIFNGKVLAGGKDSLNIVGVARDVRKAVEYMEQVSIYRNTLAQKTKELETANAELRKTQEQLIQSEKLAVAGQLSYGLAHEIRNPLAIILQGVDFLEKEIGPDKEKQSKTIDMIKKAVIRSDKIIRGLFDFSKNESLELKPKDINKVISDSIELTQYQLKAGDIKLIKDYGIRLPAVYIDEDQMKQVFVNVTLNSIQAMPRGGDLIFRTFTQRLKSLEEITVRGAEDFFNIGEPVVIVEIEDTGIGIPEDKLGKIFDPFFTSKRPDKGMGLGLSITQTIIRNHRGSIRIEGKQGKGTRVSITLSAATEKGW